MLTNWFSGPKSLPKDNHSSIQDTLVLVEPSSDTNITPQVSTLKTTDSESFRNKQFHTKFSHCSSLLRAIARVLHLVYAFRQTTSRDSSCKGWYNCGVGVTVEELDRAKKS